MVYYFSGSLTRSMIERLITIPGYEPIDVLVSQLDRGSIANMREYKSKGWINRLFVDSGAFSDHRGDVHIDVDEYIDFLNGIDGDIEVCAQVDKIPGRYGQPKSPEDFEESARLSWENYLYMRTKLKSPHKLTPVFHQGESMDHLKMMLDWVDDEGNHIDYIGISPANDRSQNDKDIYMSNVYDVIRKSNHPHVKTHLYGMTSIDSLRKFPAYSADSISHRLIAAYSKMKIPKYGVVPVSRRARTTRVKSNLSILDVGDDRMNEELDAYLTKLGTNREEILNDATARMIVTMYTIIQDVKDLNKNGLTPPKVPKKLF